MKVYGHEISDKQIQSVISGLMEHTRFQFYLVESLMIKSGVDGRNGVAYRAADRLIQKMRKSGKIVFSGGYWHWLDEY